MLRLKKKKKKKKKKSDAMTHQMIFACQRMFNKHRKSRGSVSCYELLLDPETKLIMRAHPSLLGSRACRRAKQIFQKDCCEIS